MENFYEKLKEDFSFLNNFGFFYSFKHQHYVMPSVIFENKKYKLYLAICFSSDMNEDRFRIDLYRTKNLFKEFSNGQKSEIFPVFPLIKGDLFGNELEKLTNKGVDKGYEIQYPIVKGKLIELLYELKKEGMIDFEDNFESWVRR